MTATLRAIRTSTISLCALLTFSSPVHAQSIEERYHQARELYAQRLDLSNVDRALDLLDGLADESSDSTLRYDIYQLMARAYNCKAFHFDLNQQERIALYEKGMEAAESAMDENYELMEAPYLYAVNLGRWGIEKGIGESLARKDELIQTLETAEGLVSRDGLPGDQAEGYGVEMALGRMYYKLPSYAGGDLEKSRAYHEKAYRGAPHHAENVVYYAEVLYAVGGSQNREQAKALLDELLTHDPLEYNPQRPLETSDAFAEARELRHRMRD